MQEVFKSKLLKKGFLEVEIPEVDAFFGTLEMPSLLAVHTRIKLLFSFFACGGIGICMDASVILRKDSSSKKFFQYTFTSVAGCWRESIIVFSSNWFVETYVGRSVGC